MRGCEWFDHASNEGGRAVSFVQKYYGKSYVEAMSMLPVSYTHLDVYKRQELDTSGFTNPAGKNAADLVQYAIHAYEEHWGYVWGTFGHVLTESLFEAKLAQYPDALAGNADFIRQTWVGGRTTDCVGLIKGYGWLDAETEEIVYNTNGMLDITANEMYHAATVSGTIDTIPETPGLAVWHEGHIGVYIGNGEVVEAMGTRYGVVKTKLEGARWTHWLKIPYISYD